jgi:hypothetical protein
MIRVILVSQGVFPDRLNYATVIPLHKKDDRQNMSNYRPVSNQMICTFAVIIESLNSPVNDEHM